MFGLKMFSERVIEQGSDVNWRNQRKWEENLHVYVQ